MLYGLALSPLLAINHLAILAARMESSAGAEFMESGIASRLSFELWNLCPVLSVREATLNSWSVPT